MKKRIMLFLLLGICCVFMPLNGSAEEERYIVLNTNKYFRDAPGGSLLDSAVTDGVLLSGMRVDVISTNYESGHGCNNAWYKVSYNGQEGYICSSDQAIVTVADVDLNGDFEKSMLEKGFKESYLPYLKSLHEAHPLV